MNIKYFIKKVLKTLTVILLLKFYASLAIAGGAPAI